MARPEFLRWKTFAKGTEAIAHAVADATDAGAFSLIGGAIRLLRSTILVLATGYLMSLRAAVPCSNIWKAKNCPA